MATHHRTSPAPRGVGLIELSVIVGAFLILSQVTWPQLGQVRWRAQQAEAKEVLNAAAAGARAHFIRTGSYRCGTCDATLPVQPRYTYLWAPDPHHPQACARTPAAQAAQQSDGQFIAVAVRPVGQRLCELWQVGAQTSLRRQLVLLPTDRP